MKKIFGLIGNIIKKNNKNTEKKRQPRGVAGPGTCCGNLIAGYRPKKEA